MSKRWTVTAGLFLAAAWTLRPAAATAQEAGIPVGSKAPIVSVHDLDGKPVDLGQWIGKRPVFLEFWASWCTNCAALLPTVKAAAHRYGSKIEFVGINVAVNQTPARAASTWRRNTRPIERCTTTRARALGRITCRGRPMWSSSTPMAPWSTQVSGAHKTSKVPCGRPPRAEGLGRMVRCAPSVDPQSS